MTNNKFYKVKAELSSEAQEHLTVIGARYNYRNDRDKSAEERVYTLIAYDNDTHKIVYLDGIRPMFEYKEFRWQPLVIEADLEVYVKMMEKHEACRIIMYKGGFEVDYVTFEDADYYKDNPVFWTERYSYKDIADPELITDYMDPTCKAFNPEYQLYKNYSLEEAFRNKIKECMRVNENYLRDCIITQYT